MGEVDQNIAQLSDGELADWLSQHDPELAAILFPDGHAQPREVDRRLWVLLFLRLKKPATRSWWSIYDAALEHLVPGGEHCAGIQAAHSMYRDVLKRTFPHALSPRDITYSLSPENMTGDIAKCLADTRDDPHPTLPEIHIAHGLVRALRAAGFFSY